MHSSDAAPLFAKLLQAQTGLGRALSLNKEIKAGDTLFREGDWGDGLYVVLEGSIQISTVVGNDDRRILSEFGPDEFFGEMAVIDEGPRSATATATKDSKLLFVSRQQMEELMERSPSLVIALLRDFSHRMRDFNRQYVQEMLEADRLSMFGKFARSIVHDLKGPLHVITMAVDVAASANVAPEDRSDAQQHVHQQVDRLVEMLNEMLRVTEGPVTHSLKPTIYEDYIESIMVGVGNDLARRKVGLELEKAPPATEVRLNSKRLNQAFVNLFNNAAEFMPNGGRIILRFESTSREVITEIEDTGPGFADGVVEKLFTPFFTQGKATGSGLGLAICKNIIEDHGGRIWARHEPGRGGIFCFSLPLCEA